MEAFLQQISTNFFLNLPSTWVDWILLCLWISALVFLIHRFSQRFQLIEKNPLDWLSYTFLTILCSSLFRIDLFPFHVQVFPSNAYPGSEIFLILFQAIPWVATALFGKRMLSIFLAMTGSMIFSGFWGHNLFYVLLIVSAALLFNYFLSAKDGLFSQFNNHPLVLISLVVLCIFPLFYIERFASFSGEVPLRFDLCFHDGWIFYLSRAFELMIAGIIAEILAKRAGRMEKSSAPSKTPLGNRTIAVHFISFFYLTLVILTLLWNITRQHALNEWKSNIKERIGIVDTSVVSTFTANAIRIDQLSKEGLIHGNSNDIREQIKPLFQPVQNLDAFYLFDRQGELVFSYPYVAEKGLEISDIEVHAFQDVLEKATIQAAFSSYASDVHMSILYPITGEDKTIQRVVIARVNLQSNPVFLPLATLMQSYQQDGLQVAFINTQLNAKTAWSDPVQNDLEETATLLYAGMGLEGWGIEMSLTKKAFLIDFFYTFLPYLTTMLVCVAAVSGLYFLRWERMEKALINLTARFSGENAASDQPERNMAFPRSVLVFLEVLKTVFKKMDRRHQETQTLLDLWNNYDSHTEFQSIVRRILSSFAEDDSLFVEILLEEKEGELLSEKYVLSLEKDTEDFSYLDEQIQAVSQEQNQLVIGNTTRFHQLVRALGKPFPQALIISKFPIDSERTGIFVHAFRSFHEFSKDEIDAFNKKAESFYNQIAAILRLQRWLIEKRIFSNLFDSLNFPLFLFINQELIYGNKAAHAFLKIDETEVHTHIEKRVQENEIYNVMLRNSSQERAIITKELPSGEKYEINILNSNDPTAGNISVLLLKDITREKKRQELTHDFVGMLSHDLRSPITVLQGYSKMLPMVGELNPTQQDYLEKIKGGLETMLALVEGILTEDRIEKGVVISPAEIDLGAVIQEVIAQFESLANQKRVKISVQGATSGVFIKGDAILLKQAFYNVIHNAIKFSGLDGSVEVKLLENDENVVLEVRDSGPGIAALDIPFIFEKYYYPKTGDLTAEKTGGSGLYITKFIIDAHRGSINVDSELGKSTAIRIILPKKISV